MLSIRDSGVKILRFPKPKVRMSLNLAKITPRLKLSTQQWTRPTNLVNYQAISKWFLKLKFLKKLHNLLTMQIWAIFHKLWEYIPKTRLLVELKWVATILKSCGKMQNTRVFWTQKLHTKRLEFWPRQMRGLLEKHLSTSDSKIYISRGIKNLTKINIKGISNMPGCKKIGIWLSSRIIWTKSNKNVFR